MNGKPTAVCQLHCKSCIAQAARPDLARGICHFAAKLSGAEIDALAVYYAKLPGRPRPAPASAVPAHRFKESP